MLVYDSLRFPIAEYNLRLHYRHRTAYDNHANSLGGFKCLFLLLFFVWLVPLAPVNGVPSDFPNKGQHKHAWQAVNLLAVAEMVNADGHTLVSVPWLVPVCAE